MTEPSGAIEAVSKAVHETLSRADIKAYLSMHAETAERVAHAAIAAMPTPSDQEKRISELEEALKECARVLRDRIPRIGPEGPNTADEQQEYEEVGGAWSMADRALSPERSPK